VGISDGEIPREVSYILERRHYVALNREQFLSIENKAPVEVALPGEGTVFVRIMSGLDREQFGETCKQLSDTASHTASKHCWSSSVPATRIASGCSLRRIC
jgi:hypothetical protein